MKRLFPKMPHRPCPSCKACKNNLLLQNWPITTLESNMSHARLEGNDTTHVRFCPVGEGFKQAAERLIRKNLATVMQHLGRPRHGRIFHNRLRNKQPPTEAQGLPSLYKGAAGICRLNNDGGVRE